MKETRKQFIEPLSDSVKKAYILLFRKLDEYEKETGKIFEENFTEEIFVDFTKKKLIGRAANSVLVKVSLLKKYAESLNIYSVVKLRRDEVIKMTEEHLKELESENEYELRYVSWSDLKASTRRLTNVIDVAIVYLIRMGVSGASFKELANLKVEDIDLKNKILKLPNRNIKLDDDVCKILDNAINQNVYTVMLHSEDNIPNATEYHFNMDCEYFIKQKPKKNNGDGLNPYKFSGITNRIFRIMNELGLDVTAINLLQSYTVDRLREYEEKIGKKLSLSEAKDYFKSIGCKGSDDAVRLRNYLESKEE